MCGGLDFVLFGWHFIDSAAVDERDVCPKAQRRAGTIYRGISAADHRDLLASGECAFGGRIFEVVHPEIAPRQVTAGIVSANRQTSTDGDTYRVILLLELFNSEILAHFLITQDLNASLTKQVDFLIQYLFGQAIFRNTIL